MCMRSALIKNNIGRQMIKDDIVVTSTHSAGRRLLYIIYACVVHSKYYSVGVGNGFSK